MATKSLDTKLERILADPGCGDFIIADAKDADMAFGLAAPGKSPEMHGHEARFRTLQQYRDLIRANVRQGLVDIMLMSASTSEVLTLHERIFDDSHVTPAIRANDTTDVWLATGGAYPQQPSKPFRSATIDHAMCGKVACEAHERKRGADLGLYSVTFNNDVALDHHALEQYKAFRLEAEAKGFRHFLEVFDPNAAQAPIEDLGRFLNDMIVRTLAGVVGKGRPTFLKIPYHGPEAMESLVSYDRGMVVGILGGSAGTTFDAFFQLADAKKYGARVALYGRMINASEDQASFIECLRGVADSDLEPAEAVRAYHGKLQSLGVSPYRPLEDDLKSTLRGSSYSGKVSVAVDGGKKASSGGDAAAGASEFDAMTPEQKVQWNLNRWNRVLG
ncbi:hypothetical protein [Mucisphaera calidilacus]|uniref:Fructose-bisphosphate aldolase n=1 Tax=Mucisphaera calidilacus TaxID=2527982 RepID=A0A518C0S2_9BACT|nr:hypothetical protein [Mucisphaera calidilacus]QDU72825.1 hypothetical protein Pan265_27000 [Mucisphaera calidilacus]